MKMELAVVFILQLSSWELANNICLEIGQILRCSVRIRLDLHHQIVA